MARFIGGVKGKRGPGATRTGSKRSGLCTWCQSWKLGAKVHMYVDSDGNDCITIVITGGSNDPDHIRQYLGPYKLVDGALVKIA